MISEKGPWTWVFGSSEGRVGHEAGLALAFRPRIQLIGIVAGGRYCEKAIGKIFTCLSILYFEHSPSLVGE